MQKPNYLNTDIHQEFEITYKQTQEILSLINDNLKQLHDFYYNIGSRENASRAAKM
jgi:hypothetical protein